MDELDVYIRSWTDWHKATPDKYRSEITRMRAERDSGLTEDGEPAIATWLEYSISIQALEIILSGDVCEIPL